MRALLRGCLISLLVVTLVEAPVSAAPSNPLGVVMQAQHARLGTSEAAQGATVFNGDNLATELTGNLYVHARGTQIYLLANTSVSLSEIPGGISAALQRGTFAFSSSGNEAVQVRASQALIQSRAGRPVYGRVTVVGPNELEIASYRGEMDVAVGDETHVVSENSAYRVLLEPSAQGQPPSKAGRARFIWIVLIGIAVGTGIGIWRALISPSRI
jgi:hypothetical protein